MDPYQQPAPQPGQYDFITNPAKPRKRSMFSMGGGNKTGILMIFIGGLIVLILILVIGSLFLGGDSDRQTVLDVAQKQSRVIAVADAGIKDGGTNQAQSLGLAVKLSVTSEQQALVAQLSKSSKVKPKQYAAGMSSDVATQLENAQRNGRFDEAFTAAMKQELNEYQQELKSAHSTVSGKTTKELLANDYKNVGILLSIPAN